MPRGMSPHRLARLNKLLRLLASTATISREKIFEEMQYETRRTLERDMEYLRKNYGSEIVWEQEERGYTLKNAGAFTVFMTFTKEETVVFLAGINMVAPLLPDFASTAFSLQEKMRSVFPKAWMEEAQGLAHIKVKK